MGTGLYGGVIVLYLALFVLLALRRLREDPFLTRETILWWLITGLVGLVALIFVGQLIVESCTTGVDTCIRLWSQRVRP
jgi:hypothetical protein